jgi:carboxyl-terminal processing protease
MSKELKTGLVSLLIGLGLGLSFGLGYMLGNDIPTTEASFASVEEAWQTILNEYVEKEQIDPQELSQGAIEGMLAALDDPYSAYLNPEAYQMDLSDTEGHYSGIGASVGVRDDEMAIIAVYEGSPAAEAGIQAGDVILEIDGQSTAGMDLYDAVSLVRGDAGTSVVLLIQHPEDSQVTQINVVRGDIEVPSVGLEIQGDIAYISIESFTERTNDEMGPVLQEVIQNNAAGIILDLRGNPGGLLETVVLVASRFLDEGEVLTIRDSHGNVEVYAVVPQEVTVTDIPMVVLVNGYSASGSEVVAGALQDHQRALIAGQTTYGKGSANTMVELPDGSGLYLTIARWLTPNGNLIEGVGIVPDVELDLDNVDAVQWAVDYLHQEA